MVGDDLVYSFDRPIPPEDARRLFQQTAWARTRTPEGIQAMLDRSVCLGVWEGERLVGFGRAVTDDLYRAFIEDVIVDEARRGQGIGGAIMARLLERLDHVEEIVLSCEDHLVSYYERFGFRRATHQFMNIWKGG
jgi:GNAT superfamily N-acetyltransferase